jgi:hypothetical protein
VWDGSARMKLGSTMCSKSLWASDSSIGCRSPALAGSHISFCVSASGLSSFFRMNFSYNFVAEVKAALTLSGSSSVFVLGSGFYRSDGSCKSRFGQSSSVSTLWFSDSSLIAKFGMFSRFQPLLKCHFHIQMLL